MMIVRWSNELPRGAVTHPRGRVRVTANNCPRTRGDLKAPDLVRLSSSAPIQGCEHATHTPQQLIYLLPARHNHTYALICSAF